MYHPIGLDKLSETQISRLRNGHAVRVKCGNHHKLHVSEQQHKKIMSAHKKGKAHTLMLDPFQQHQMKNGHGFFDTLKNIAGPAIKTLAPVLIDKGSEALKNKISGTGIHHKHPKKGRGLWGDLAKAVLPSVVDVGSNLAKNYIGGHGIHHKKHSHKSGSLLPAGSSGLGHHKKKGKRGKGLPEDIISSVFDMI